MARTKVKFVPFRTDDKAQVLRKLQERPYFEKILTRSSSPLPFHCPRTRTMRRLLVPAWFVHKHSDKIRELVILRTDSSTKAWPVTLEVSLRSPTASSVRFASGWNAFAISNRLLEGDSLIFALTSMSEFEVYIFRSSTNNRDATPNAKANLDLLHMDNRIAAANAKAKLAVEAKEKLDSLQTDTTCPTFFKRLTTTNVARGSQSNFAFPADFMKVHGSRIHSVVKLQGIHEQSPEQSMKCCKIRGRYVRYFLQAEWRLFAARNHLQVGQELLFTLVADSFFIVREVALPTAPSIALQKFMQDSCTSSSNSG